MENIEKVGEFLRLFSSLSFLFYFYFIFRDTCCCILCGEACMLRVW